MAHDCMPTKRPGQDVTGLTTATVVGCCCVQITDNKTSGGLLGLATTADGGDLYHVGHPSASGAAGAGKGIFGVAKYDAASGKRVGVIRGGIVPILAGAAITAGNEVEVTAAGAVIPLASGRAIGVACDDAANAAYAEVALY